MSEKESQPLFISETQRLGIDHTYVGNLIAEKWKLGNEISDAITYHHTPETYQGLQRDILFTVILSDHFANRSGIGFSGNCYLEPICPDIQRFIRDDTEWFSDQIDMFSGDVEQEIEKAQIFLKIAG
jgi:hypothetical protein